MKKLVIITLLSILYVDYSDACTTFVLDYSSNLIYGRNFDWDIGDGFVVINRRGLTKTAFVQPGEKPAEWVSKYGSITFNQIGINMPMGGMNEKGLVIAQMALFGSKYPEKDERPVVGGLDWIQYQLDNSKSLSDVIENNKKIRIIPDLITLHFLICDSKGNVGTIEFLNGEVVVHKGNDIIVPVCSNDTYEKSMNDLKGYAGFGGEKEIPVDLNGIPDIIAKAGTMVSNYSADKGIDIVDYGFNILESVGSPTRTQWSIIFDIKSRKIFFKSLQNRNKREIKFKDFDFSCKSKCRMMDIQKSTDRDINSQFVNFSPESYREYKINLYKAYNENVTGFPVIPDEVVDFEIQQLTSGECD
ncbi:MAG: linear amide C-N hydrolase [Bacteroidales bacterium]|nr:MAG: linear amide C-N hydrolase [Bacteroidales bacterium]